MEMDFPPKPQLRDPWSKAGCLAGLILTVVAVVVGLLGYPLSFVLVVPTLVLAIWSVFAGGARERSHYEAVNAWRRSIAPPAGDSWKHQFEAEGLSDLIPTTEPHVRLGLRLEKKPFDGKLGASRLGGFPDLPFDVDWPERFVAQINLAEVAAVYPGAPLPTSGYLWFLCDDEHGYVHYASAATPLAPPQGMTQTASGVRFVLFEDIPENDRAPESYSEVQEYLSGHKLFGYGNWVQCASEEGQAKRLLLQLDTDDELGFQWGDAGMCYFLIDDQDLKRGRFEAATFEMQCS